LEWRRKVAEGSSSAELEIREGAVRAAAMVRAAAVVGAAAVVAVAMPLAVAAEGRVTCATVLRHPTACSRLEPNCR
jgi:hypothetical protein